MKNPCRIMAVVLSILLVLPSLAGAQDGSAPEGSAPEGNAPEGYLPASDAAQNAANDAAPEGYLPARDAEQNAANDAAPEGYLPAAKSSAGRADQATSTAAEGYAPAPATSEDTVDGGRLMLLAYAGFWLIALGYIATLAQRARRTSRDVVELHRQVQELDDRLEDIETRARA